jgi:cysteine synthase
MKKNIHQYRWLSQSSQPFNISNRSNIKLFESKQIRSGWNEQEQKWILTVTTEDAMVMARRLAKEEGIFAGTSTGANIAAALKVAKRFGRGKTVATLIVDSGLRYISTPLYQSI